MSLGAEIAKHAAEIAVETAIGIIRRMVESKDRDAAFDEFDRLWFRAKAQARLDARKGVRG